VDSSACICSIRRESRADAASAWRFGQKQAAWKTVMSALIHWYAFQVDEPTGIEAALGFLFEAGSASLLLLKHLSPG